MAYKCKVCGFNDVEHPNDICELCAISADPYTNSLQQSDITITQTQTESLNTDNKPIHHHSKKKRVLIQNTNNISTSVPQKNISESNVQVYPSGELPLTTSDSTSFELGDNAPKIQGCKSFSKKLPLTSGIIKNVTTDLPKRYFLVKLFQALFYGIDFPLDDDVTLFQVFPDYTGISLNPMGYACDQVIVYGKVNCGLLSENNAVEVYGIRDLDNKIISKKIINTASGTTVTPDRTISANFIRGVSLGILLILLMLIFL